MTEGQEFWMIERQINGQAYWWMSANGSNGDWNSPLRWTNNWGKARHFGSKAEAEWVIGESYMVQIPDCVATGHMLIESVVIR